MSRQPRDTHWPPLGVRDLGAGGEPRNAGRLQVKLAEHIRRPDAAVVLDEEPPRWPYGPASFHQPCCRLHAAAGAGYCDCAASDASDTEWGRCV
jgi:hypothetical protein